MLLENFSCFEMDTGGFYWLYIFTPYNYKGVGTDSQWIESSIIIIVIAVHIFRRRVILRKMLLLMKLMIFSVVSFPL